MELVNRVANSKLQTIDLEKWYPSDAVYKWDLKDYLFKELILKEKDFRTAIKEFDTSLLEGKIVCVYCSTDAIIPTWAYMLVASSFSSFAKDIVFGTPDSFVEMHYQKHIDSIDINEYEDAMIVLKGCSKKEVPVSAYLSLTKRLSTVAKSIMFGEPCSTVPIFKKRKK